MKYQIIIRVFLFLALVGLITAIQLKNSNESFDYEDAIDYLVDSGFHPQPDSIDSDLLSHRKIVLAGDINTISARKTIKSLLLLNTADPAKPMDLYILTGGGWIDDAFAIIDVIESLSAPVNTHAIGATQSSGAMILSAGTGTRYGYPHSSIMFHAGRYPDDESPYSNDRLDNERIDAFLKQHAKIPEKWMTTEEEEFLYLSSEKALKWGLIDEIKTKAQPLNAPDS